MSAGPEAVVARAELASIVGDDHVLTDPELRAGYETDWTGRWSGRAACVVRPGTTEEVAAVMARCDEHRITVLAQGGNTGLVGGSVPRADADRPTVIVSTRRLREIGDVDAGAAQITLGAGVTIAEWRDEARRHGFDAPVDFAARDSATIGGAIATNAGGSRVLRFGTMRQQVMGIRAVLADGRIVGSLAGLPKETAGLHWPSLIAGSEGTLAVVTAARLRLVAHYGSVATALVTLAGIDHAIDLLATLRSRLAALDAVELVMPGALDLVAAHLGATPPATGGTVALLIECADHDDPTDALVAVLAAADGIVDSAIGSGGAASDDLVRWRDRITEAIAAETAVTGVATYKLDVAVPVGALGRLLELAEDAATSCGARLIAFGHLAEGNVHLNYLDVTDGSPLAERVLPAVADLGGTISAEHGIGVAKSSWLHLVRSPAELAAQAAIRRALDPHHILNPGVLESPRSIT